LPYYNPARQIACREVRIGEECVYFGFPNETLNQGTPKGDYDVTVKFNKYGFRDDKDLRDSNGRDWFVVGDSFAIGWGVDKDSHYSSLLEGLTGRRFFNIAIPNDFAGYAALLKYAENHGARIDNLIVSVCMENDLRDYWAKPPHSVIIPSEGTVRKVQRWLRQRSALYVFLSYKLQENRRLRHFFENIGIARRIDGELLPANLLSDDAIASSADYLVELTGGYRNVVVLIIPSRGLWAGKYQDIEKRVHGKFIALLDAKSVKVLDLRPIFEATGRPMAFTYESDPHWNEDGHRLAAQALNKYILDNKLL